MPPGEARPKGDDEQADMEQAEMEMVMSGLSVKCHVLFHALSHAIFKKNL